MTKRTAALHYPEGTTKVGTATVHEDRGIRGWAQKKLAEMNGTMPNSEVDEIMSCSAPVRSLAPVPMPRTVKFTVAGDPVAKGRPRASRTATGVRMRTPKKTAVYERHVKAAAIVAMAAGRPFARPVRLLVSIVVPIPASWSKVRKQKARTGKICATKKPDADNVLKAIKDAMNDVVYADDAQVVEINLSKAYGDDPRVEVVVSEIDKEAA